MWVLQEQKIRAEEEKEILELGELVVDPNKEQEGELREAHPLRFLRPKKVGQSGAIDLKWVLQEQKIRAEEGKGILELGEQVVDPKKEEEGELREAHPLRFLRPKKVGQSGAIDLKRVLQEQKIRAEEGKEILEFEEQVVDPKKELEGVLREAHPLYSRQEFGSQSEKVHP